MNVIGILTFPWAYDHGTMLQCYALKTYLSKYQGTVLIPYAPDRQRARRRGGPRVFDGDSKARFKMRRFREEYLTKESRVLGSAEEVYEFDRQVSVYVTESGRVWEPEKTGAHLADFDGIAKAKPLSASHIEKLRGKRPALDPVFLLEKEEWEALPGVAGGEKERKKKYIAVYHTEYNREMAEYLKRLEKKCGCGVLVVNPWKKNQPWTLGTRYALGCGPLEFLEILYHAEYVVTNSFHAMAFSIIFHKQFVVFLHSALGAGLRSFLRTLHLENRVAEVREDAAWMETGIDWEQVDTALERQKAGSREFIEREILRGGS